MHFKIAEIPYLNCAPFYWKKDLKNFATIPCSPKKMGLLAKRKKIDAGPISLVDSFELEEEYEELEGLGIAVKNRAKSVLLFSKRPIQSLFNATIGLSDHSVTSICLLKLLLEKKYKIKAKFHLGFKNKDDAQLYIGDAALKKNSQNGFKTITDLGDEWFKWQKLPFVFARWMVRKELSSKAKELIAEWLKTNLDSCGEKKIQAIQWFKKKYDWDYPKAQEYLQGFQYHLGKKEKKAISVFKTFCNENSTLFYSNN
ncbi:MAG: hypothetical protein A2034_00335 [Elusimicrobia bacterium GWA2_38_7]|nr:MAG: hypothetical protein A2034_00335 [Elusimicrobia bacterium GWA2_38_7]